MVVYQNHGDPPWFSKSSRTCFFKIAVGHPISDIHRIPNIGCVVGYAVAKIDFDWINIVKSILVKLSWACKYSCWEFVNVRTCECPNMLNWILHLQNQFCSSKSGTKHNDDWIQNIIAYSRINSNREPL
jgi:hypothetical protein